MTDHLSGVNADRPLGARPRLMRWTTCTPCLRQVATYWKSSPGGWASSTMLATFTP